MKIQSLVTTQTTMAFQCAQCNRAVTARMHAIQFDRCDAWQHRKCDTGITPAQYKAMVAGDLELEWMCRACSNPAPALEIPESAGYVEDDVTVLMENDARDEDSYIPEPADYVEDSATVLMDDARDEDSYIPETSFDITGRNIEQPDPIHESSLQDQVMGDQEEPENPTAKTTTYHEVSNGSIRGGRKLASSDGFTYTVRRQKDNFVYWWCSVRNKKTRCPAWVKQYGRDFIHGPHHCHEADPGAKLKLVINAKVKQVARENIFRPTTDIIETVMKEELQPMDHCLPKMCNLKRVANLHRQRLRPVEPKDADFVIDENFIQAECFLVRDIRVDGERHLLFATKEQLDILARAKRWFVDGTFQVVSEPFYQLMSVHAFVKQGDCTKQLPLAFCLMTRRTKRDYAAVFDAIKLVLQDPVVEWVMMDFEAATWQAVREVFPRTILKGCCFHWTQAVYRKVQSIGLASDYMDKKDKYRYIRKLLSLPFLPAEHIRPTFGKLEEQALNSAKLTELTTYIRNTWIDGQWRPENWSVFRETVRTNNDVEGWHRRLNMRAARSGLTFYVLVPLLLAEADYSRYRLNGGCRPHTPAFLAQTPPGYCVLNIRDPLNEILP